MKKETNNIFSIEEEQLRGRKEEKIKESIKQQEIPVPDTLKPEQIQKRLQQMGAEEYERRRKMLLRSKNAKRWVSVAAGIVLFVGVSFGGYSLFNQPQEDASMSNASYHASQDKSASVSAAPVDNNTYKEAYDVLEEYYQYYYAYEDYEDEDRGLGDFIEGLKDNLSIGSKKYSYSEDNAAPASDDMEIMEESQGSSAMDTAKAEASDDYSKNNVRTEGVEECNIVRTDGRYIYEYDENSSYINIYNAKKEDTSLVGEINLNEYQLTVKDGFYVSDGILTISATSSGYSLKGEDKTFTRTLLFDIKNPEHPKFLQGFFQDGSYQESRMVGDVLYVFSNYSVSWEEMKNMEPEKPEGFIPKFEDELIPEEDLYVQPDCRLDTYTLISSINVNECRYIDKKTILGGSGKRYVSSSHIYLLDMAYTVDDDIRFLRFTYEDGQLSDKTNGKMRGEINDDYSLDEYQGYLRMVTHYYDNSAGYVNGLFIYDENLKQTGSVKGIAKGEEVKSVRFIGDTAYFVTYRNTDPLFAVDVSNPEKPKVLGYLKIPGFSTYLHPYGDELLLGIGLETDEDSRVLGLKLSMYDISDSANIKEIDKLVLEDYYDSEGLYDANALLVDAEKNLIGFGAEGDYYNVKTDSYTTSQDYLVYSYDKKQGFVRRLKQDTTEEEYLAVNVKNRGLYISDYFYVVTVGQKITAYKMEKTSFKPAKAGEEEGSIKK